MTEADQRQGQTEPEPRKQLLHGSVNGAEYKEVDDARREAGYRNMSECIRTLGLLFARLPAVRALVEQNRSKAA